MKHWIFTSTALVLVNFQPHAQSRTYLNENGFVSTKEESVSYVELDSRIFEIYSGKIKSYHLSTDSLFAFFTMTKGGKDGLYEEFYTNGQTKVKKYYSNNFYIINKYESWYANGQPKEIRIYPENNEQAENMLVENLPYKIHSNWDSLGTILVNNGNGVFKEFTNGGSVLEYGSVKNGLKNEVWKVYYQNGNIQFDEIYSDGALVSGENTAEDSTHYSYDKFVTQPSPAGGMAAFYSYIGKNIKYPNSARRKGIQGKVFVQFVVDKTGDLIDVRVLKGISPKCDHEAVETISNSANWIPGYLRSQPIKVRMILPITFSLK